MQALRAAMEGAGYASVRTYIQSGNVIFESSSHSSAAVGKDLAALIRREFSLTIGVVVRTQKELAKTLRDNPFLKQGADSDRLYVAFLEDRVPKSKRDALDVQRSPPDEFIATEREIFLHCPAGLGRTKLTNDYFERVLGVAATVRNWRTVQILEGMAGAS